MVNLGLGAVAQRQLFLQLIQLVFPNGVLGLFALEDLNLGRYQLDALLVTLDGLLAVKQLAQQHVVLITEIGVLADCLVQDRTRLVEFLDPVQK